MGKRKNELTVPQPTASGAISWVLLIAAAIVATVFLFAQGQGTEATYGAPERAEIPEGSGGELRPADLPSVEEMTAMVAANPVVRLPGARAEWDTERVRQAIGGADIRILVAPAGLAKEQREELNNVENAEIQVMGTRVTGSIYEVASSGSSEWREQFARNDVTGQLLALIPILRDQEDQPGTDDTDVAGRWREPGAAELESVARDLRADGRHVAPGTEFADPPSEETATAAFGGVRPLLVVLPAQPVVAPAPDYGPALTRLFPDTPIVVMYGSWIEYHGPRATEFADAASASFYARFGSRLSLYAYPQDSVLHVYLNQVSAFRYAGLFDRPLPYVPFDPLTVAMPALPWIFAGCAGAAMVLSAWSLLRPRPAPRRGVAARLGGLSALAVEVSGLTDKATDAALTRAITALSAAGEAVDNRRPNKHVHMLLDQAEAELDTVGKAVGIAGYRPAAYLEGRLG